MKALDGKVALVTGGASGMGAGTVRRFAREGARVVIADVLDDKGKALAEELGTSGLFAHCDVRSEPDVAAACDLAVQQFGSLDCVFNNAGRGTNDDDIDQLSVEVFDDSVAVLLRGVFLGMKHGARIMKPRRSGTILSTASVAGLQAGFGPHPYTAAKAAVVNLTRSVATELAGFGIRVNCICPGGIATPIFAKSVGLSVEAADAALGPVTEALAQMQPLKRAGLPADIAAAAVWLASDESSFVTGQTLVVDGGLMAGRDWSELKASMQSFRALLQAR